jgi:alpha-tubulin suppressor-like RCC1 family protein
VFPQPQPCKNNFVCSANMCESSCSADTDCVTGFFCNAGSCVMAAKAVSAGTDATCVILNDGTVRCWGLDAGFQPGGTNTGSPVPLAGLPKPATQIGVGGEFGCALLNDATVWCWGDDGIGQLGNNMFQNEMEMSGFLAAPAPVMGLTGTVTAIAVGGYHSCAIVNNSTVWCWGDNQSAELGIGQATIASPQGISNANEAGTTQLGSAASIAVNAQDSYAVMSVTGILAAWGDDYYGQLGNEMDTMSGSTPITTITSVSQHLPNSVIAVAAGNAGYFACAILNDGTVWCWGYNLGGALGDGHLDTDEKFSSKPVEVVGLPASAASLAAGGESACTILHNNTLWCWGQIAGSPTPVQVTGFTGTPTQVSIGWDHACALMNNGSVWCWSSNNNSGELGNGGTEGSATPGMVVPW